MTMSANRTDREHDKFDEVGGRATVRTTDATAQQALADLADKLDDILAAVDGLEGFTDGLEGFTDGIEGFVDGLEGLLNTLIGHTDQLEGYLDGVEGLLTTIASQTDLGAASGANTRPVVDGTSREILAANADRKFAYIWNQTGTILHLSFVSPAVFGQQIRLANNDLYEIDKRNLWKGAVYAIRGVGASANVEVFEAT